MRLAAAMSDDRQVARKAVLCRAVRKEVLEASEAVDLLHIHHVDGGKER